MEMIDIRKIKVWLMRNRNLINFLKIVIIVLLSIVNNTNEKFVVYVFYLLIFDSLVLIQREQKFCKKLVNIFLIVNILVERLIYIANNYNIANIILSTLYIVVILIATELDLIANRVKYNFTLWDKDLISVVKKDKVLIFIKMIVITSMLLLVKVNILLIITIGVFNLFQLFLKNAEIDKIKKRMLDLLIFYISALAILFKSDSNSIVSQDMGVILGNLVVIIAFWIADNRKN
jgi:membrane protein